MIDWTREVPRWVLLIVALYVTVLLFVGAASHVADLVNSGLNPYPWAPSWLNLYWSSLAFLDPLAAVLLIAGRRGGVHLTCLIMATDLAANAYAAYGVQHTDILAVSGLQRITAFTLFVFLTAPFVRRHLSPAIGRR
ncbi:hypothetical protein AB0E96_39295 [Kitasatospora sp. NPDC036755]|uniref:hypothetical protein n=1 Tax=Kitasatospora sp. NPDC036755 TaxID=3154600 RepID=UPI0033CDDCA8